MTDDIRKYHIEMLLDDLNKPAGEIGTRRSLYIDMVEEAILREFFESELNRLKENKNAS